MGRPCLTERPGLLDRPAIMNKPYAVYLKFTFGRENSDHPLAIAPIEPQTGY